MDNMKACEEGPLDERETVNSIIMHIHLQNYAEETLTTK